MEEKPAPFTKTVKSAAPDLGRPSAQRDQAVATFLRRKQEKRTIANQASNSEIPARFSVEVRMRLMIITSLALVVGLVMAGAPLLAHHGTGCRLREGQRGHAEGTVTEWFWANPHAAFCST